MAKATMRSRKQTASTDFVCDICGGPVREGERYLRTADIGFERDEDGHPVPLLRRRAGVLKTHLRGECHV